jgi:hypothetical protein
MPFTPDSISAGAQMLYIECFSSALQVLHYSIAVDVDGSEADQ